MAEALCHLSWPAALVLCVAIPVAAVLAVFLLWLFLVSLNG